MQTHASFNHALIILQKNFDSGAHDDNGRGFRPIQYSGCRKEKHKIPRSYSAAGKSAASSTETRDDEPLVKANRVRYRNKVTASHDDNGADRKNFGNFGDFGNVDNLLQFSA
jgi:hypothetical protein